MDELKNGVLNIEIHGRDDVLSFELVEHIERRLRFALGRFTHRIGRVTAHLADINGPRGGIDKRCRITVALIPRGKVLVERQDDDPFAVVTETARRARRAVRRFLERRRRRRALRARVAV